MKPLNSGVIFICIHFLFGNPRFDVSFEESQFAVKINCMSNGNIYIYMYNISALW